MVKRIICGVSLLLIAVALPAAEPCPYDEDAWKALSEPRRAALLRSAETGAIDDSCFVKLAGRLVRGGAAGRIPALLKQRCERSGQFSLQLLYRTARLIAPAGDKVAGREVAAVWERYNARFREAADRLRRQASLRGVDSLYVAFDNLGRLDIYDQLQWAGVKLVLNEFGQAAALYCGAVRQEASLLSIVQSQCGSHLDDLDNGQRRALLKVLADCGSTIADRQTRTAMLDWIVRSYARFGFRQEERAVLASGMADSAATSETLLYTAQRFFEQKLFPQVLDAARRAWAQSADAAERTTCSRLLCQAFAVLGQADSAALWLGRAQLTDRRSRVVLASLLQQSAMVALADSLVRQLPSSVDKDTLIMRGMLFSGQIGAAADFARKNLDKPYWRAWPAEVARWRLRTALFSGELAAVTAVVDSTPFSPAWSCGQEFLAQKYALSLMEMDPASFSVWGQINYRLFVGTAGQLADSLQIAPFLPAVQELMVTTLAEGLLDQGQVKPASRVLSLLPDSTASARVQFFRGRCDYQAGDLPKATERFERLILNHPQDIFSSKARMYLMKMASSPSAAKAVRGR